MLSYSRFMEPSSIQSTPPIFVSWNNNWNQSEWDQNPLTIPAIIETPFHPCIWIYFSLRPGCWSLWRLVQIPWNEVCISEEGFLKKQKVKVRQKRRCHEVCSCKSITLFQDIILCKVWHIYISTLMCWTAGTPSPQSSETPATTASSSPSRRLSPVERYKNVNLGRGSLKNAHPQCTMCSL